MKNIFIYVYAKVNLGDDLFIKILLERYPDTTFTIVGSPIYTEIFREYKNLRVIGKTEVSFFDRLINNIYKYLSPTKRKQNIISIIQSEYKLYTQQSDGIIVIGGSLFQQYEVNDIYYDYETFNALTKVKLPIYFLGCNFGPFVSEDYLNSYKELFAKATDVSFREEKSFNLFKDLSNIRFNPDIVYGMDFEENQMKSGIGFSIVGPLGKVRQIDRNSYVEKYVSLIDSYIAEGKLIKLFSFCKDEGDEEIITEIYNKLSKQENVEKVFYDGNINNFLRIYSSVEAVYCGRFHAMILSMVFDQHMMPIVYSKKMVNVLNDINFEGNFVEFAKFNEIDISTTRKDIISNKYDISKEKIQAKNHFSNLDKFLKNG